MSEAAKWYVIHTYSGYENKVAQNIEKVVENRKLHDLIQEVRVPTEMVTEITDGKTKEIERKTYPGYVLVKMIVTDDSWYVVRNTRGCTGFVGPASALMFPLLRSTSRSAIRCRSQVQLWTASSASFRTSTSNSAA